MIWGGKMKKLAIFIFVLCVMSSPNSAAGYDFMFHADFLESVNPGGWSYSLKTFEDEYILNVGSTVEFDIWVHDVPLYEGILSAALWIEYNPSEITIISVDVYDGVHGPPGPWDPGFTNIVTDPYYTDAYAVYTAAFYPCALPDSDEDLIIAKVSLYSSAPGDTSITFKHIPGTFEPTLWGCDVGREYWAIPHTITIHQELLDSDADGIPDYEDNCPNVPNGSNLGTCVQSNFFNNWIVCINSDCLSNDDCDIDETCQKNRKIVDGDGLVMCVTTVQINPIQIKKIITLHRAMV